MGSVIYHDDSFPVERADGGAQMQSMSRNANSTQSLVDPRVGAVDTSLSCTLP